MKTGKETILAVDNDPAVQEGVRRNLEKQGYRVVQAAGTDACLRMLESDEHIDLILMDLELPGEDGMPLISRIRNLTNVPILVVSGKKETTAKVVGLELGADDYIEKPFDRTELLARIKAALRRHKEIPETLSPLQDAPVTIPRRKRYVFNDWRLDPAKFELYAPDGTPVALTVGEFTLLHVFVQAPQQVLSREKLFELTRGEDYESYDRAVDTQIARLRKKLKDDAEQPKMIKTVRGVGYMFGADVKIVDA